MSDEDRTATWEGRKMTPALKAELEKSGPTLCKACGKLDNDHTFFFTEDIETLRSQGCSVTLCDDSEPDMDLSSIELHWGYILAPDGSVLQTKEIHARCKAPDDPCDGDYVEDISS